MCEKKKKRWIGICTISLLVNVILFVSCFYLYKEKIDGEDFISNVLKVSDNIYLDYEVSLNNEEDLIDAVFLYQNKNDVAMHGVKVIIDGRCYTVATAVDSPYVLGSNSIIHSIEDDTVLYSMDFDDKCIEFKVSINTIGQDINFKVETLD